MYDHIFRKRTAYSTVTQVAPYTPMNSDLTLITTMGMTNIRNRLVMCRNIPSLHATTSLMRYLNEKIKHFTYNDFHN